MNRLRELFGNSRSQDLRLVLLCDCLSTCDSVVLIRDTCKDLLQYSHLRVEFIGFALWQLKHNITSYDIYGIECIISLRISHSWLWEHHCWVTQVLMLYTPFPPETASIYAMQQFLQLGGLRGSKGDLDRIMMEPVKSMISYDIPWWWIMIKGTTVLS